MAYVSTHQFGVTAVTVDVQRDEGREIRCEAEAVPDVCPEDEFEIGLVPGEGHGWGLEWGWGGEYLVVLRDGQQARNEFKPSEGWGVPQDELLEAGVWLDHETA